MVSISDVEALRQTSLKYLWMHNRDWIQMAEEGEPQIIVEGHGVKVVDAEGRTFIDVRGRVSVSECRVRTHRNSRRCL